MEMRRLSSSKYSLSLGLKTVLITDKFVFWFRNLFFYLFILWHRSWYSITCTRKAIITIHRTAAYLVSVYFGRDFLVWKQSLKDYNITPDLSVWWIWIWRFFSLFPKLPAKVMASVCPRHWLFLCHLTCFASRSLQILAACSAGAKSPNNLEFWMLSARSRGCFVLLPAACNSRLAHVHGPLWWVLLVGSNIYTFVGPMGPGLKSCSFLCCLRVL